MTDSKLDLRNPLYVSDTTHELLVKSGTSGSGGSISTPSYGRIQDGNGITLADVKSDGTDNGLVVIDNTADNSLTDLSSGLDPTAPSGSIAIAAGNASSGDTITISDGVHTAITFEFDVGAKATGTIDLNGNPSVGEYVTISDGAASKIFEFGSAVQPDAIEITIGGTATDTMTNLITAINASVLTITASPAVPADETCTLLADTYDTIHNVAITESSATIVVSGMSGGLNPGEDITPGNTGVILGATYLDSCTNIAAAILVKKVAGLLAITSTNGGAGTVTLVNDVANSTGNVTITKSGANITVTGMSGGTDRVTFRTIQESITNVTNTDGSAVGTKGILIQGTDGTNAQTMAVTTSGEVKQSLDKIAGTATAVNSGAATNGTQRMIHASDDPAVTTLGGTTDAAAGDANASINAHVRQIAKYIGTNTVTSQTQRTWDSTASGSSYVAPGTDTAIDLRQAGEGKAIQMWADFTSGSTVNVYAYESLDGTTFDSDTKSTLLTADGALTAGQVKTIPWGGKAPYLKFRIVVGTAQISGADTHHYFRVDMVDIRQN